MSALFTGPPFPSSLLPRALGMLARAACALVLAALALPALPVCAQGNTSVDRYIVPAEQGDAVVAELRARFPESTGARFAYNPRTEQLIVISPTTLQAQIAAVVASPKLPTNVLPAGPAVPKPAAFNPTPRPAPMGPLAGPTPLPTPNPIRGQAQPPLEANGTLPMNPAATPPSSGIAPAAQRVSFYYTLARLTWPQVADELKRLGGGRFVTGSTDQSGRPSLVLTSRRGGPAVTVEFDPAQKQVTVTGTVSGASAWRQMIERIDAPPKAADQAATFVALQKADPTQVRVALAAVGADLKARAGDQATRVVPAPGKPRWGGDLVMFQQPAPPAPAPMGEVPPPAPGAGPDAVSGVFGDVTIEFIPGLDIYIIKGKKNDVDRVVQIINDIERLSVQTQPVVEVHPLKHVESEAIAALVTQVYDQILFQRQGQVSITPLVKPNALLIIGRADSVQTVVELVNKLDEPVPPQTQFAFIPLKHATASNVETTITTMFPATTGLGPKVRVLADFRTNSIIVRASPRDLAEVNKLVKQLDAGKNEVEDEVRIFPLRNSLADDLAATLNATISGNPRTGAGAQGQPVPPPQPAGAAGGANNTIARRPPQLRVTIQGLDAQGKRILQSGILNDVRIVSDPRGNSLIVTGPAESMDLIAALIMQLDRLPSASAQIKVFTIVNGDATQLQTMLNTLFGAATGNNNQQGIFQPLQQTSGDEGALVRLRFSVDQRTNSIIASGSAGDLAVVEAILLRLDESDVRQRQNSVYRLKSAPAADIANALNQFLQTQRDVRNLAPETISPFEQIEREVIVVPEPVSNSLIISATPRYFSEIMKIVDQLDARPPMVLIQVLIAQVDMENFREIGAEFGLQDSLLFDRSAAGVPGFNFNNQPLGNAATAASVATRNAVASQGLTNFALGRSNTNMGYGGLVLSAASDSVNILVRALQDRQRLQLLSRPQVMTLDNQPAFIQVGSRVPYVTSTTVGTTGTSNSQSFQNVGILLGVTPRITPDGLVLMEIDAEKSELGPIDQGIPIGFSPAGTPILSPQINTTTAQTTVSSRSGQTVILGGLITKTRSVHERRIPFISDIPVLGNAFRYDSWTDERHELLIIMTPYVVRTPEDVEWLKQMESQRTHWCLADVVNVHGDVGLSSACGSWQQNGSVIYPDENPTGEVLPAPEGRPAGLNTPSSRNLPPPNPTPADPLRLGPTPTGPMPLSPPIIGPPSGSRLPPQGPTGPSILPPRPTPENLVPPGSGGTADPEPDRSSRRGGGPPGYFPAGVQPATSPEIPAVFQQPVNSRPTVQPAWYQQP